MDSILNSVKIAIGLPADYTAFDASVIMHLNTAISIVTQLGVGEEGYIVTDERQKWQDFIDDEKLELVKTYISMKTKYLFDPPTNSSVTNAMEKALSELEFRISVMAPDGGGK